MTDTVMGTPLPLREPAHKRLDRFLTEAIRELKPMSKLTAVAEAMAKLKAEDEAEADKLMVRITEHAAKRPTVITGAHAFLDRQKNDLDDLESGLRSLSNLPLPSNGSGT